MPRTYHPHDPGSSRQHSISLQTESVKVQDLLGSSPEFGDFESAPASTLEDGRTNGRTLLPVSHAAASGPSHQSISSSTSQSLIDLLSDSPTNTQPWPPDQPAQPIHIALPPRPSEIPNDYVPPVRSPRRLSSFSMPGPSSPPQLSDVVFDPFQPSPDPQHRTSSISRGAHSTLVNTLATTTKLASKWKSSLDHSLFHPPPPSAAEHQRHSFTAQPIDVNHDTPFSLTGRGSEVFIPPSGAPGFRPENIGLAWNSAGETKYTVSLSGRRPSTAAVLTEGIAEQLRPLLPPRQRLSSSWSLMFSLDQHGSSLSTLYRLIESYAVKRRDSGNMLVVRDAQDNVFGAYLNECIVRKEGQYYGGGDTFLFKIESTQVKPFRWTGKNQYFALCETGLLSFGGGTGAYGLALDSTFTHNSTATCPTFDNEILNTPCSTMSEQSIPFECLGLEVWAVS